MWRVNIYNNVPSFASRRKDALKGKARCIKLDLVHHSFRLFFFQPRPSPRHPFDSCKRNQFYGEVRSGKMDPHGEIPTDNPCGAVINIENELIPGEKNRRILPSAPTTRFDSSVHDLRCPEWEEDFLPCRPSCFSIFQPSHVKRSPNDVVRVPWPKESDKEPFFAARPDPSCRRFRMDGCANHRRPANFLAGNRLSLGILFLFARFARRENVLQDVLRRSIWDTIMYPTRFFPD